MMTVMTHDHIATAATDGTTVSLSALASSLTASSSSSSERSFLSTITHSNRWEKKETDHFEILYDDCKGDWSYEQFFLQWPLHL